MPSSQHDDLIAFMKAKHQGVDETRQMVFDPVTKKFVVRDEPAHPDDLPVVSPEDLQAFAGS